MLEQAREPGLPAAACEALSGLCNAHFFEQRPPEMAARAREALQAAERLGSPHHLAEARGRVAQALVMEGKLKEARRAVESVIAEAQRERLAGRASARPRVPRLRALLAQRVPGLRGAHGEALVVCEERGDGFEALRRPHVPGLARANQGRIVRGAPRPRAGRSSSRPATAIASGSRGWSACRAGSTASSPTVEKARGSRARARARARESLALDARDRRAAATCAWTACARGTRRELRTSWRSSRIGSRGRDWFRWMNDLRLEVAGQPSTSLREERSRRAAAAHVAAQDRREAGGSAQLPVRRGAPGSGDGARGPR